MSMLHILLWLIAGYMLTICSFKIDGTVYVRHAFIALPASIFGPFIIVFFIIVLSIKYDILDKKIW